MASPAEAGTQAAPEKAPHAAANIATAGQPGPAAEVGPSSDGAPAQTPPASAVTGSAPAAVPAPQSAAQTMTPAVPTASTADAEPTSQPDSPATGETRPTALAQPMAAAAREEPLPAAAKPGAEPGQPAAPVVAEVRTPPGEGSRAEPEHPAGSQTPAGAELPPGPQEPAEPELRKQADIPVQAAKPAEPELPARAMIRTQAAKPAEADAAVQAESPVQPGDSVQAADLTESPDASGAAQPTGDKTGRDVDADGDPRTETPAGDTRNEAGATGDETEGRDGADDDTGGQVEGDTESGDTPAGGTESRDASAGDGSAGDTGAEVTDPPAPAVDAERWLATYRPKLEPETLRETAADPVALRGVRDRLTEKIDTALDNRSRARLLSLRAVVSRLVGDLDRALDDGQLALTHAQATGELRRIAIAQARLAHVLRCRGDFAEADRLYAEANSPELPDRLRAALHEQMARSCYDQHRYIEACIHFERALDLRRTHDRELLARTEAALDAVFARVAARGWGPYARSRDEVLQKPPVPTPHFDAGLGRWGYADTTGELVIDSSYAEAQPFRDEVAWVRAPDNACWELIDRTGKVLIGADAGFREVRAFSDELAWVRRGDTAQWLAVEKSGEPAGPAGFDDVRPFRRGVAAVRRGRWGAVDSSGELVVAPSFDGFVTALTDGRYLDGFTDEGLAVVEAAGRKGVVDRQGRMPVRPAHPALVIHPVAFLIGDGRGRWGALDRRGDLLIEVVHDSRATVLERIDRLLADTEPLL